MYIMHVDVDGALMGDLFSVSLGKGYAHGRLARS